MSDKNTNENTKHELLKQLHEQYAVNNNANLGTIVTLLVAVIAVIGYFGYVYVHTGAEFSTDFSCLIKPNGVFYLDALLLIYLVSVLVIAILVRLCIYQGIAQRKEQFIIDAIRSKYFGTDYLWVEKNAIESEKSSNKEIDEKIFPKDYHPYLKKKIDIVQGLYGELVKIFQWVFIVLTISIVAKVIAYISKYDISKPLVIIEIVVVVLLVVLLSTFGRICYFKCQIKSYESRQNEYFERRKEIENYVKNMAKGKRENKKRWICNISKLLKQKSITCKSGDKSN